MLIIQHSVCTAYPSAALITVLRHIDVVAVFFIFCGDACQALSGCIVVGGGVRYGVSDWCGDGSLAQGD